MLKYYSGLELNLIEQIILRKIVSNAIEELSKIKLASNRFQPATEGAIRFLFREYGLNTSDKKLYRNIIGGYYDSNASEILNFIQNQINLI